MRHDILADFDVSRLGEYGLKLVPGKGFYFVEPIDPQNWPMASNDKGPLPVGYVMGSVFYPVNTDEETLTPIHDKLETDYNTGRLKITNRKHFERIPDPEYSSDFSHLEFEGL